MKKLENKKNILVLEKMGCNFFINDEIMKISDLNNYRYYTYNIKLNKETIAKSKVLQKNKNNILKTLEISHGARYLKNSKGFKHADNYGCYFNTYYNDDNGSCYGLYNIDQYLNSGNYSGNNLYNKATILNLVNSISAIKYDDIKIIERY